MFKFDYTTVNSSMQILKNKFAFLLYCFNNCVTLFFFICFVTFERQNNCW